MFLFQKIFLSIWKIIHSIPFSVSSTFSALMENMWIFAESLLSYRFLFLSLLYKWFSFFFFFSSSLSLFRFNCNRTEQLITVFFHSHDQNGHCSVRLLFGWYLLAKLNNSREKEIFFIFYFIFFLLYAWEFHFICISFVLFLCVFVFIIVFLLLLFFVSRFY